MGIGESTPDPFEDYEWELYNLKEDFTQSKNLAKANPEKLDELRQIFLSEARKNQVFPSTTATSNVSAPENRPPHNVGRTVYTYFEGTTRITEGLAPNMKNRSYSHHRRRRRSRRAAPKACSSPRAAGSAATR